MYSLHSLCLHALYDVCNSPNTFPSDLLSPQVMFAAGYLTLFGKEFGEDKCQARQAATKALVLNALENFKEFDKIFPALVAGLPIHVFKSAYSAREVSGAFPATITGENDNINWHLNLF